MRRCLALLVALAVLGVACDPAVGTGSSASPQKTADIKRSKLDIVYSFMADSDVHKVSSRKLLESGILAVKSLAKRTGGADDVAMPEFQDVAEPVNPDFVKFATAVGTLAAKNPQLSADRIADTVVNAFQNASPDCHTYYVSQRSSTTSSGISAQFPSWGYTPVDDEAGLQSRMIGGNIGYVAWREFLHSGAYDISDEVKKRLDQLLAQGAKAWLLDLRGNNGGDPPQTLQSFFLKDGEKTTEQFSRTGSDGIITAKGDLRLPEPYQLPIAILLNGRAGSSPEVFALGLHENKRATIVGSKSAGCLGATNLVTLPDGTRFAVAVQEFVGAVTGAKYNKVGIPPDVPADDATAIDVATKLLQDKIAGR